MLLKFSPKAPHPIPHTTKA